MALAKQQLRGGPSGGGGDEPFTLLSLLSLPELLLPVASKLDPASVVALMATCKHLRDLFRDQPGSFWRHLGDGWGVPGNSDIYHLASSEEEIRTVAHLLLALDRNLRRGKCDVWKVDLYTEEKQPCLVQTGDDAVDVKDVQSTYNKVL